MHTSVWRPTDETEAVGAEAVFLEWLAAIRGGCPEHPAGLRDWARYDIPDFRAAFAAFAAFAGIDPDLADAAAGWLLGAGVRPDDRVMWTGDPAAPCLAGLTAIGGRRTGHPAQATITRDQPPVWPPPVWPPPQPAALRPAAADPAEE